MKHEPGVTVPEAALAASDHMLGDTHASLTLLAYGDYECPAFIRAKPMTQQLVKANGRRMGFVCRNFPLMELLPHADLADRICTQRVQEHRQAGGHSGVRAALKSC